MTESGEDHEKCHGELCVGFHGDGRVALMGFICDCPQEYSPLIMIMLAASGGFRMIIMPDTMVITVIWRLSWDIYRICCVEINQIVDFCGPEILIEHYGTKLLL